MVANNLSGQMIGHYNILDEVGDGGFGCVYLAQNIYLPDRVVALKILHAKHNSPENRKRFQQEAKILFELKHRYILPFIDFFSDKNEFCLVTEYEVNGSLRERIKDLSPNNLLPTQVVDTILSQIGEALQNIHQRNIIHRDLKPQNILFNAQGEALLADFGIAKIAAATGITQAIAGRGTGTPAYMAPEQASGKPTAQSDQYALACMTYELLVGDTPFSGSQNALLYQHAKVQPTNPRMFNPQILEFKADAILKALAKDPDDRHVDIAAYLIALGVPPAQETIVIKSQRGVSQRDTEERLEKGNEHLQDGHFKDALKMYNQATELDPKSAKAYCRKGEALKQLGENWKALTAYDHALSLDPEYIPAYIGKGDTHNSLGHHREALEAYQKAGWLAPDSELYQKIANIHIELKECEDALTAYDTAIRYGANPIETRNRKIALLISHQRNPEVIKEYDYIIQFSSDPLTACYEKIEFIVDMLRWYDEDLALNEILATYEQIIKLKHGAFEVYREEITCLEKLVENEKRLAVYDRIIEHLPDEIKVDVYYKETKLLEQLDCFREVPAICDRILKLAPNDIHAIRALRKKLEAFKKLKWPEYTLEDGLVTCDQIIERSPYAIDAYRTKLELLSKLKRYGQEVITCDKILALDPNSHETHHQKGNAYEMLERSNGRIKDNVLSARLTPVSSYYLDALVEYEKAAQLAPDNSDYLKSREELLRRLRKFNQAEIVSHRPDSGHPAVSWLVWMLSFVLLPTLVNVFIGFILLAFFKQPWMLKWVVAGTLSISVFGVGLIRVSDRRDLVQRYHLYNASILFGPVACFAIEWLIVGLVILHSIQSTNFVFPLVCLFVFGFVINAGVYLWIDRYEEYTFVLMGRGINKLVKWLGKAIIYLLGSLSRVV